MAAVVVRGMRSVLGGAEKGLGLLVVVEAVSSRREGSYELG